MKAAISRTLLACAALALLGLASTIPSADARELNDDEKTEVSTSHRHLQGSGSDSTESSDYGNTVDTSNDRNNGGEEVKRSGDSYKSNGYDNKEKDKKPDWDGKAKPEWYGKDKHDKDKHDKDKHKDVDKYDKDKRRWNDYDGYGNDRRLDNKKHSYGSKFKGGRNYFDFNNKDKRSKKGKKFSKNGKKKFSKKFNGKKKAKKGSRYSKDRYGSD